MRYDTIRALTWIVCAFAIASGLFFRVHGIDRKIYGVDEAVTSLRVAGGTLGEVRSDLRAGRFNSLAAVHERYQLEQPQSTLETTISSLERDDPQHPPLYFILERVSQRLGDSIVAWRALSVFFGLALIIAVFWLGTELLGVDAGIVATALVAVSPFHIAYAQYNREYAFWELMTALSSVSLLIALRRGKPVAWVAYLVTLSTGLYTYPFFLNLVVTHATYVCTMLAVRRLEIRTARVFAVTLLAAMISYVPWLVVLWNGRHVIETTTEWYATPLPAKLMLAKWFFEIVTVFFDAEYGDLRLSLPAAIVVIVAGAIAFFGMRTLPRGRAAFLFFLMAASAAPLVVADLLLHQSRSTAGRYLSPTWLGFELAVAAGIAALIRGERVVARRAGLTVAALLVLAAGASDATSGMRTSWWIDSQDGPFVSIARALSSQRIATLCYVDDFENVLVLSDSVAKPVRLSSLYENGCLAVATATEIRQISSRAGAFVRQATVASDPQSGIDELHEETGRAHSVNFEKVELWQYRVAR